MKAQQHEKDIRLAYAEELRRFRLKLAELHRTIHSWKIDMATTKEEWEHDIIDARFLMAIHITIGIQEIDKCSLCSVEHQTSLKCFRWIKEVIAVSFRLRPTRIRRRFTSWMMRKLPANISARLGLKSWRYIEAESSNLRFRHITDDGTGMNAQVIQTKIGKFCIQFAYSRLDINTLIMEDHCNDIVRRM